MTTDTKDPYIHQTNFGKFLICNPEETIQRSLIHSGQFEIIGPLLVAHFQNYLPGLVVDVGANIGTFSVVVANALRNRKVIAIEPQRMVFMELCANSLINQLTNIKPMNIAVGNTGGHTQTVQVPFFNIFHERYTGSVSLDEETQKIRSSIQGIAEPSEWASEHDAIDLCDLDVICKDESIFFIKVDVEGMELDVLRGAENILRSQHPFLFFESWNHIPQFSLAIQELEAFVEMLGYETVSIGNDTFAFHSSVISLADVKATLEKIGLKI